MIDHLTSVICCARGYAQRYVAKACATAVAPHHPQDPQELLASKIIWGRGLLLQLFTDFRQEEKGTHFNHGFSPKVGSKSSSGSVGSREVGWRVLLPVQFLEFQLSKRRIL